MKTLLFLMLSGISMVTYGQTKEDFVECLELIFGHEQFQPAFGNDDVTNGALIILALGIQNFPKNTNPELRRIRHSLTQSDFFHSRYPVKILSLLELEQLNIPKEAAIDIYASGSESEIVFGFRKSDPSSFGRYSWSYTMVKVDDEWEIIDHSFKSYR